MNVGRAPIGSRWIRRYRTGRNVQFNVKALQETVDAFYSVTESQAGWVLVPDYGGVDIEARDDTEALRLARSFDTDQVSYYEGDWDGAVCKRIVSIEDGTGKTVAADIPLDDYRLHRGIEAQDHKASVTLDIVGKPATIELEATAP